MKKLLFYIFIGVLLMPAIQNQWQLIEFPKLKGSFVPAQDIDLSAKGWFAADYQAKKEKYIKDHIGFRPVFVRTHNQILYSLFSLANNPGGVVGDDGYLYLESYIYNYTGENFIGERNVNTVARKLKYLQGFFASKNISLITVIAPSKASYYPEYIPTRYKAFPKSNYEAYCHVFDSLEIDYIDINKYIVGMKDTTSYPLFSKNGVHWTSYGMGLGMDTIIKKIEQVRQIKMRDFSWEKPIYTEPMSFVTDYDAESLMNLVWEMPRAEMPYPKFVYGLDEQKAKPKTLVVSDSYYWRAYKEKIPQNMFDWGGFWYYFNTAREEKNNKELITPVKEFNLKEKLLQQDVIVLFASQATLHIFPYGFDSKVFTMFMPQDDESLIVYYKNLIENNKKWKQKIIEKAQKAGITYEEQQAKEAKWLANKFKKDNSSESDEINKIINRIRADKKWFNSIKEKAKAQNIPINEMMERDAKWIYNNQKKN